MSGMGRREFVVQRRTPAKISNLPFVHHRVPFHFILLAARIWQYGAKFCLAPAEGGDLQRGAPRLKASRDN
jgi:hypothetical protein